MPRLFNWRSRFVTAVTGAAKRPFSWGSFDCVAFGGMCVEALTGENPYAEHAGKYDSAESAAIYLESLGHSSLDGLLSSLYEPTPQALAWEGDLALVMAGDLLACGVIVGERVGVLAPDGYGTVARSRLSRTFKIGH